MYGSFHLSCFHYIEDGDVVAIAPVTYETLSFNDESEAHSITCNICGRTSYNLNDVVQKYCGHCHIFHDDEPGIARVRIAE